jgi:RNA-directed DNA polymerase
MPVEGRSLSSRSTQQVARDRRLGNLATPGSVQALRTALHTKANAELGYRFYTLYDKVIREDVLAYAYACCKANQGAAGVDTQQFEDIEAYGEGRWLWELAQALRSKTYQPEAVRRVYLPKPNGKLRPLGIPTIRDRVVQTAAMLVLEPIFEADLTPQQNAYRPGRSAHTAVKQVHRLLSTGHTQVIDADLSAYFDRIPHSALLQSVARRITDRAMLHLLKMWLETPVEEADERGNKRRTTVNRDTARGTPQGSPISPLLANVYMRRFILGWQRLGLQQRFDAHIVNYADDLVICCRRGAEEALMAMRHIMARLDLTVNEEKTHLCRLPEDTFDFLGYTFGRCYSSKHGRAYLGTRPSRKSIRRMTEAIRQQTSRSMEWMDAAELVERLNRTLRGWANYFSLGPVTKVYRRLDRYTTTRLRRWHCKKHKVSGTGLARFPDEYLYESLGLIRLPLLPQRLRWANV